MNPHEYETLIGIGRTLVEVQMLLAALVAADPRARSAYDQVLAEAQAAHAAAEAEGIDP